MRALIHILTPLIIICLGVWGFFGTQKLKEAGVKLNQHISSGPSHRPPSFKQRKIHTKASELVRKDFTIHLHPQGIIRTHNATNLTAQVSGKVIEISPKFEDGAYFKKGDTLLKIDTADYLTALASAKAKLAKAEALFAQEKANANQALLNWKDPGLKGEPSDLVLRKPQLHDAEANVLAARAEVEQAERNLERTQVVAPYDGRVRKRTVGLGQQIGTNTQLGEVFSTAFAEVRLPISAHDLKFYTPPNKPDASPSPPITFTTPLTPAGQSPKWKGRVLRAEGELDTASRQLFVIARIDDPFGLKSDAPSLFIGQPVQANIPAQTLKNVYIIPRKALTDVHEILVVREGKIKRLKIKPIWTEPDLLIIRDGVLPGDMLVTSQLPYAPEGAAVEILPDTPSTQYTGSQKKTKRRRMGAGSHK